ncbi:MAG: DUF2244 domain-containing protein [Alphaproteobacteria bacterium]|jgi:uncharacterized membrane protein|nr:DUF2244 domain-containing protein [Alphaproteobacteria bacterium]|tara:strand:+ start:5722 stop:6156 length:435 start_codon:yes stop_codon:yes gene_type:complete
MRKNIYITPNKSLSGKQIIMFLLLIGFLILFIGIRFVFVGAWPIIIFGIAEFTILVVCTYFFYQNSKKGEKISLTNSKIILNNTLEDKEEKVLEHNLAWTKVKNENDSLSLNYSGKKTLFARFLNNQRRVKLKKIIDRYKSRFQ